LAANLTRICRKHLQYLALERSVSASGTGVQPRRARTGPAGNHSGAKHTEKDRERYRERERERDKERNEKKEEEAYLYTHTQMCT